MYTSTPSTCAVRSNKHQQQWRRHCANQNPAGSRGLYRPRSRRLTRPLGSLFKSPCFNDSSQHLQGLTCEQDRERLGAKPVYDVGTRPSTWSEFGKACAGWAAPPTTKCSAGNSTCVPTAVAQRRLLTRGSPSPRVSPMTAAHRPRRQQSAHTTHVTSPTRQDGLKCWHLTQRPDLCLQTH